MWFAERFERKACCAGRSSPLTSRATPSPFALHPGSGSGTDARVRIYEENLPSRADVSERFAIAGVFFLEARYPGIEGARKLLLRR